MHKLLIPPDQDGYSLEPADDIVSTMLAGGMSRSRRDIIGASSFCNVNWTVGPEDYKLLRAFFNGATHKGTEPFLIDLIIDNATLDEYTVKFVRNTFRLTEQSGLKFVVSAQLEVKANIEQEQIDEAYYLMISLYGDQADEFINELETLVNVQMPGSLV